MGGDKSRVVRVFRYDPSAGGEGHYDRFEVEVGDAAKTTILDLLLRIQGEHDPSLAFRYACRVSMCGSCAMVVNGREGLACKTIVGDLPAGEITIRPLNHAPVIKDLVTDMGPFFEKYEESVPFFEPAIEATEPAIVRPDSKERKTIGLATECIACGCCVSSCTMAAYHPDYLGPAAINRAFTLLADSRDGLQAERMEAVLESCYACRTELSCTEVCPKELSPTRAIKYIQTLAWTRGVGRKEEAPEAEASEPAAAEPSADLARRGFLGKLALGVGGVSALGLGSVVASAALGPSLRHRPIQRLRLGAVEDFPIGDVRTVEVEYEVEDGFHRTTERVPVPVARPSDGELIAFNCRCTHLGCQVRWDPTKRLFLCACHGGSFYPDGRVRSGPPPRPMDTYPVTVENGALFVEVS